MSQQDFVRRTANSFNSHKRRARQAGHVLDYDLDGLRTTVARWIGTLCPGCQQPLTETNFSTDHAIPISRGGSFYLDNIAIICTRCNQVKGSLTNYEFDELFAMLRHWEPQARKGLLARLRAGGRFSHS